MSMKKLAVVSGEDNATIAKERLRITSIIESPAGKRNPAMANKLALFSALDAETAIDILKEAPAVNPYLAAMDSQGPIGLSAATADFSPADPKEARLKEIAEGVAHFNASRGYKKAGA